MDSVALYLANGDGTFQTRQSLESGDFPRAIALADLNGDQKLDLLTSDRNSKSLSVMLGNGDGTFGPRMPVTGPFDLPYSIAVGYLNGDNNLDLVLAHFLPHGFSIFMGNGDGTFGSPVFYTTSATPDGGIAVGDLNGDGYQDVMAGAGTKIWIYRSNGNGTLSFVSTLLASDTGMAGVGVADFNGDLKLDLAAAVYGGLGVWLGNGNATFGPRVDYPTAGTIVKSVAIEDFNGDGFRDVAVTTAGAPTLFSVFSGIGDGTFPSRADFKTADAPFDIASGDFDGDQRPDVAVPCTGPNVVSVFLNRTTVVDVAHPRSIAFLAQSVPNPVRDTALIRFSLQEADDVTLRIYDVSGRVIQTLMHGRANSGWHAAQWDRRTSKGSVSPSGVYLYELRSSKDRFVRRMTLLKP